MGEASGGIVLWSIAAGVSVALAAYVFIVTLQSGRAEARQHHARGGPSTAFLFKLIRPVARGLANAAETVCARVALAAGRAGEESPLQPARLWGERRLRAAAYPQGVTADELLGMVIFGGVIGALAGALANLRLHFGPVIVLFALAGMYMPLLWLNGCLRQRQNDIRHGLPYALDLLTLSVEAGLDFTQALSRIVKKLGHGPLAVELGQTVRDIQLGRTRPQALRDLSRRAEVPELNSVTSALIQADELGTSLGPILRVQAEQLRTRRSQSAEKQAMEAPVKILLPLILFIFPTIFIMIFGPIALKLLR